jgi:hypothetical protein
VELWAARNPKFGIDNVPEPLVIYDRKGDYYTTFDKYSEYLGKYLTNICIFEKACLFLRQSPNTSTYGRIS